MRSPRSSWWQWPWPSRSSWLASPSRSPHEVGAGSRIASMSEPPASLQGACAAIRATLGPAGCIDDASSVAPFLTDFRGLYQGKAALVVQPATTAEVAAVLAICNASGVGVVPHGGNTSYCGGAT